MMEMEDFEWRTCSSSSRPKEEAAADKSNELRIARDPNDRPILVRLVSYKKRCGRTRKSAGFTLGAESIWRRDVRITYFGLLL